MRTACRIVVASSLMLLTPVAAHANIWIPSLVECIMSPVASSLFLFPLLITVPVLLGVSVVEALVVRRYAKETRLARLVDSLLIINAITSLFGTTMVYNGAQMWRGLLVCYALTVVAEGLLLIGFAGRLRLPCSLRSAFAISLRMNTVSYALLAGVLTALVYIPSIGNESPAVRESARGRVVTVFGQHLQVVELSAKSPERLPEQFDVKNDSLDGFALGSDGQIVGLTPTELVKLRYKGGRWQKQCSDFPTGLIDLAGLSPDGRYMCCVLDERPVVYDLEANRVARSLRQYSREVYWAVFSSDNRFVAFGGGDSRPRVIDMRNGKATTLKNAWHFAFSPTGHRLAWESNNRIIIRDCTTGQQRSLKVPGSIRSGLAWSPDGRHIAYLGHANQFTAQMWTPDARAVDVETGESATLRRGVQTGGAPCPLFWLD